MEIDQPTFLDFASKRTVLIVDNMSYFVGKKESKNKDNFIQTHEKKYELKESEDIEAILQYYCDKYSDDVIPCVIKEKVEETVEEKKDVFYYLSEEIDRIFPKRDKDLQDADTAQLMEYVTGKNPFDVENAEVEDSSVVDEAVLDFALSNMSQEEIRNILLEYAPIFEKEDLESNLVDGNPMLIRKIKDKFEAKNIIFLGRGVYELSQSKKTETLPLINVAGKNYTIGKKICNFSTAYDSIMLSLELEITRHAIMSDRSSLVQLMREHALAQDVKNKIDQVSRPTIMRETLKKQGDVFEMDFDKDSHPRQNYGINKIKIERRSSSEYYFVTALLDDFVFTKMDTFWYAPSATIFITAQGSGPEFKLCTGKETRDGRPLIIEQYTHMLLPNPDHSEQTLCAPKIHKYQGMLGEYLLSAINTFRNGYSSTKAIPHYKLLRAEKSSRPCLEGYGNSFGVKQILKSEFIELHNKGLKVVDLDLVS